MSRKTRIWLRSLVAAAISGGAHALSGSAIVSMVAPETFNFTDGFSRLVQVAVGLAVTGALTGVAGYLSRSPLPEALPARQQIEELKP